MNRNASYPNYLKDLKCKRSNTEEIDHKLYRSDGNDNGAKFKPERICYNFVNTGQCRLGHRCKYRHINRSSSLEFDFRARNSFNSSNCYTSGPRSTCVCILLRMPILIVNLPG